MYNPNFERRFATSAGLGSIIRINDKFFFNPELASVTTWDSKGSFYTSISPAFGYGFGRLSVIAAPCVGYWHSDSHDVPNSPFFEAILDKINDRNRLILGAKVGLRVRL
jgi:hypothetical protein